MWIRDFEALNNRVAASSGEKVFPNNKVYKERAHSCMMQSLGERVLDELEADVKLRKRLAELLIREPDVRLVLVNAALATVATREDIRGLRAEINQLRAEMKGKINQLRGGD